MGVAAMTAAYSKPFDELIDQAQQYARELGAIPSQNKLKAALHVRSERARGVLAALRASGFDPAESQKPSRPLPVPDEPDTTSSVSDDIDITLSGTVPWEPPMNCSEPVPGTGATAAAESEPPTAEHEPQASRDRHRPPRRS